MLFADTYVSISEPSEGIFKDRGSKFLAYAFPIKSESDVKGHLSKIKKDHHSASHYCYAFRLGADKLSFRANDDGEPSGTAGKPILGQIQSADLTNVLIIVVRYFGGSLLGTAGLIHAYREAAHQAIEAAKKVTCLVKDVYEISFFYEEMNQIMTCLKAYQLHPDFISSEGKMKCIFSVRKNNSGFIYDALKKIPNLEIQFKETI